METKTPNYLCSGFWMLFTQVSSNGVDMGFFESSSESTFTAFGLFAGAVETLTLTSSSGIFEFEGISFLEVCERAHAALCFGRGSTYWYGL